MMSASPPPVAVFGNQNRCISSRFSTKSGTTQKLSTHLRKPKVSYILYPLRPSSWSCKTKLKPFVKDHVSLLEEKFVPLRCKSCLSLGVPVVLRPRAKQSKILAFKGNGQNDEAGNRAGSKSRKNSIKLSYSSDESEGTLLEPPKAKSVPVSYSSSDETSSSFFPIQNLFKYWLSLMRTSTPTQPVEEPIEKQSSSEIPEEQSLAQRKDTSEIVKEVVHYFMSLDAAITLPLLIFVPLYLTVSFVYGAEVSKELTPLWILGPLIVALYIKLLRVIFTLYVFSFKQTVKVVKNLPTYYQLARNYIARGQLKEDIHARFVQPLVDIKNLDYKEFSSKKLKELQSFLLEQYLDFVESVWPYYCRTIRFLKRANLI